MASIRGPRPSDLSRFLHITVRNVTYPVTEQVLHQIFQLYGATTVRLCTRRTAVVSFPTMSQATRAGLDMQGCCIWDNCCWMQIRFAQEQEVAVATGAAATTAPPPASTTAAAPRSASISAASAGASPATGCVQGAALASPAPSPSALTAADEEKPVMASLAELQAALDRILANFAPIDDHGAAATSSPSTITVGSADTTPSLVASAPASPPLATTPVAAPPTTTPAAATPSTSVAAAGHGAARAVPGADGIHLTCTQPVDHKEITDKLVTTAGSDRALSHGARQLFGEEITRKASDPAVVDLMTARSSTRLHHPGSHVQGQDVPLPAIAVRVPPRPPDWPGTTQKQEAPPPPWPPSATSSIRHKEQCELSNEGVNVLGSYLTIICACPHGAEVLKSPASSNGYIVECLSGSSEAEFAAEHTSVSSTTYVDSLVNLSLPMPWDPGVSALYAMDILLVDWKFCRTESKPEAYLVAYSGTVQWSSNNPVFSSPYFAADLGEYSDTQSTLLEPLQSVIVFPLDKGLYAPWDPGSHTCLWCCCQTQEICDVLEQFYGGSSWDVEALLKHAHLYIQNDADNMKQAVPDIFQLLSAGYIFAATLALCVCPWKKDNACSKITGRSTVKLGNSGSSNDYAGWSPSESTADQQYLRPTDWLEHARVCTIAPGNLMHLQFVYPVPNITWCQVSYQCYFSGNGARPQKYHRWRCCGSNPVSSVVFLCDVTSVRHGSQAGAHAVNTFLPISGLTATCFPRRGVYHEVFPFMNNSTPPPHEPEIFHSVAAMIKETETPLPDYQQSVLYSAWASQTKIQSKFGGSMLAEIFLFQFGVTRSLLTQAPSDLLELEHSDALHDRALHLYCAAARAVLKKADLLQLQVIHKFLFAGMHERLLSDLCGMVCLAVHQFSCTSSMPDQRELQHVRVWLVTHTLQGQHSKVQPMHPTLLADSSIQACQLSHIPLHSHPNSAPGLHQWDPGGYRASAWGQADFEGGENVTEAAPAMGFAHLSWETAQEV